MQDSSTIARMFNKRSDSIWCLKLKDPNIKYAISNFRQFIKTHRQGREDALLSLFKIFTTNNINQINLNFINNYNDYVTVNDECLCGSFLNKEKDNFFQIREGEIAKGKVGSVYLIDYFEKEKLILKTVSPVTKIKGYLPLRYSYLKNIKQFHNPSIKFNSMLLNNEDRVVMYSYNDNFNNQTIQHLILNIILNEIPNYVYQYDAFVCTDTGYNILEYATHGDLSTFIQNYDVDLNLITSVVKQILLPLKILKNKKYGFVHADLKTKNILITKNADKLIAKISDFDKSSIFWNGIRFFNGTFIISGVKITTHSFVNQVFDNSPYPLIDNSYYTLVPSENLNATQNIFNYIALEKVYTMHNPYGFYLSYDIYTFFFSLMLESKVYHLMINNPDSTLSVVWKNLWFPEQFDFVMEILYKEHSKLEEDPEHRNKMIKITYVIKLIKDNALKLKYDVNFVYKMLDVKIPDYHTELVIANKPKLYSSSDNRICISDCFDGVCMTNAYSNQVPIYGTTIYKTDSCKM